MSYKLTFEEFEQSHLSSEEFLEKNVDPKIMELFRKAQSTQPILELCQQILEEVRAQQGGEK